MNSDRPIVLVSNRLPAVLDGRGDDWSLKRASGGLASALSAVIERPDTLWIGYLGELDALSPSARLEVEQRLGAQRLVAVDVPMSEYVPYYEGFSNGVLWPLLHYFVDKVELDAARSWSAYQSVNERFARAVAERAPRGALVWVHDYQLMLVPGLLRALRPDVRVGFFLHVPFPTHEVFRVLPWRDALLRGVLAAHVLGFHTQSYLHHFAMTAAHVLDTDNAHDEVRFEGRASRLVTAPISVDVPRWREGARRSTVLDRAAELRANSGARAVILGVDRLDYTKGIPRRLLAIERFLERRPALRDAVQFVQVAVPSRENVDAYAEYRRVVDALVGRINGAYGSADRVPVHLLHKGVDFDELCALYRAADVMLVTPLRDGMNLVAKEFCVAQGGASALVLSEFAGAADELSDAILVNPYDVDSVERAITAALEMPEPERRERAARMAAAVEQAPVSLWAERFVAALDDAARQPDALSALDRPPTLSANSPAVWVLDYDGTLASIADRPDRAAPDAALLALLQRLCALPDERVHVVSGRPAEWLSAQLGALSLALHAEHGAMSRERATDPWRSFVAPTEPWRALARSIMTDVVADVVGGELEEKRSSVAWHYRRALPELVAERLGELRARLAALADRFDLFVLDGAKVIELRPQRANKGATLARIAEQSADRSLVIIGDDSTDEDMFARAPSDAISIKVGLGLTRARYRLDDVRAVRSYIDARVQQRGAR
jgi:trehalose 6-phosphate synthase/phosphatase